MRCRGGYHPPGCFPVGETTSAQCADNVISNIIQRNLMVQCRNMAYWKHRNPGSANTVLLKNLPRWRAADSRPYTDVPHRTWCVFCRRSIFFEFVGAAISRPVVSPRGNNVGALRRQWHHRTFANEIRLYYVGTWYIAARCAARFPRGIAGRLISAPTLVRATLAGGCHQLTLCAARAASTTPPSFHCFYQ